jgi:hypothetical protein
MDFGPKVVNRSDTKPLYIVVVKDPTHKRGIRYYKTQDMLESVNYVEFRKGTLLTKRQSDLLQNAQQEEQAKTEIVLKVVSRKIPWHNVISINQIIPIG